MTLRRLADLPGVDDLELKAELARLAAIRRAEEGGETPAPPEPEAGS